jgi:hypothetical protein
MAPPIAQIQPADTVNTVPVEDTQSHLWDLLCQRSDMKEEVGVCEVHICAWGRLISFALAGFVLKIHQHL